MIICKLKDASRYYSISPELREALEWVEAHFKDPFKAGSQKVGDNGVVVNSQEVVMAPREKSFLEAHRKFTDIHVPLFGEEIMGWAPVADLRNVLNPYSEKDDFELFGDSAHAILHVRPGEIAIFFPEDAHAPNIGVGNHKKFCVKVPV